MPARKFPPGAKLYRQDITILQDVRDRLYRIGDGKQTVPDLIRHCIDEWLLRHHNRPPQGTIDDDHPRRTGR